MLNSNLIIGPNNPTDEETVKFSNRKEKHMKIKGHYLLLN